MSNEQNRTCENCGLKSNRIGYIPFDKGMIVCNSCYKEWERLGSPKTIVEFNQATHVDFIESDAHSHLHICASCANEYVCAKEGCADADATCEKCEADDAQKWICVCGHYEESGLHCSNCGHQPPWGCDCSDHDAPDESELYFIV